MKPQIHIKINGVFAKMQVLVVLIFAAITSSAMAQNTPPTNGNESLTINEDAMPVTIATLLINNNDVDGDPLSITTVNSSVSGTFVYNNMDGSILYYTAPDYCGIDTIVYGVSDGFQVITDTLFLTINCVNDAPSHGSETLVLDEDDPATTTPDLLANNGDVEGDPISLGVIVSGPLHGTFTNNLNNTYDYTPNPNYCGFDTVYYEVTDGSLTIIDTLYITVNCINDAPLGGNEFLTVIEDNTGTTSTSLLANNSDIENDLLTVGAFTYNGPNTYTFNQNGTVTYIPQENWCGEDTILYEVTDGIEVIVDTIFVTVTCVNDIPTGGNETVYTDINVSLNDIDVTANNTDVESTTLTVSQPAFPYTTNAGGTVTINPDGTINYTPPTDFEGLDSMFYEVCDDNVPTPGCVTDLIVFVVSPDDDGDGVVNFYDIDDDDDGIKDEDELLTALNGGDTDGDGIPDILDLDSDNDGLFDNFEAGGSYFDPDGNGMAEAWYDSNGNGMDDYLELNPFPMPDTDNDGTPDYQDVDDDGDGVLTPDEYDNNEDGIPDDCNANSIPNYLDPESCEVIVPEVFSPNFDGVNDVFWIQGIFDYPYSDLKIYNRWGTLVYEAKNYQNDWYGKSENGLMIDDEELPVGTYFYVLDLMDGSDVRKGYVYLTR